jgi:pyruvate dehydrogenase complex dehydrogenase (E1) component
MAVPPEVEELRDELGSTYEARRSVAQDTANKATDALVRMKQREQALGVDEQGRTQREQELREKYGMDNH